MRYLDDYCFSWNNKKSIKKKKINAGESKLEKKIVEDEVVVVDEKDVDDKGHFWQGNKGVADKIESLRRILMQSRCFWGETIWECWQVQQIKKMKCDSTKKGMSTGLTSSYHPSDAGLNGCNTGGAIAQGIWK